MSCSLVFTGAGGSGRTNALLGPGVEVVCAGGTVVLLVLTIARLPLLPLELLGEAMGCPLECLQSQNKQPIIHRTSIILVQALESIDQRIISALMRMKVNYVEQ